MAIQLGILKKTISGQSESDHQSEMSLLRRKINELRYEKETVELEMKNLLDSLKTLEKKIENKDSIIHTLTKDNEELTQDNTRLKDKLRKFREEETSFTLDTSTSEKNENVQCNIQTNNSFAALQDMETAMFRQEDNLNNTDITIIADSHGWEIDPKKIYRNKKVEIKVLDARKKNLDGAIEYIQSSQNIGKETVILVGNNNLQHSSVDTVFRKFHDLGVNFKKKFPSNHLSIVPILPRYENDNYNSDASTVNMRLQELSSDNISIVILDGISPLESTQFNKDKIHLSNQGNLVLIRAQKTHLNPKLGLPPYSSYSHREDTPIRQLDGNSHSRWRRSPRSDSRHNSQFSGNHYPQTRGRNETYFSGWHNHRNPNRTFYHNPQQPFRNNSLNERDILLRLLGL